MRRLWPILLLLLVAATPEETKLFRVAQSAFEDKLYDFAERQFREFLEKFPASEKADGAVLMLAQSQMRLAKPGAALQTLAAGAKGRADTDLPDGFVFWRGQAFNQSEQYAAAEKTFAALVQRGPSNIYHASAQLGMAVAQFKQGKFPEAGATLDEMVKSTQRERLLNEAQLLRGQIELALGKFAEADSTLAALAKRDENSIWAYRAMRWRAESKARQKQSAESLELFGNLINSYKTTPNKPVDAQLAAEAWSGRGWVLFGDSKFDDAVEAFTQALTHAQSASLRREVLLKLSESYVRADKVAAGVARLKEFLAERPKDPLAEDVQMAIADLFFARDDFAAALPEYQQLITRFPQSRLTPRANYRAGWCEVKTGKPTDALAHFQQAFNTAGSDAALAADALFKIGDVQFEAGQLQEASASYQRLVSSYPASPLIERALFQLGHVYQRMQNADAAVHVFQSLVEQFPTGERAAEAQFQIGLIQASTGNETAAREAFAQVTKKFPNHRLAQQSQLAIGESFYREGKYDAAAAEYDRLIAAAPDSELGQRAFYNRGWCWFGQGKAEQTLKDFTGFLAKNPQAALAPDMEFWVADYYAKQKDYVKAQEHFLIIHKNYGASALADDALFMAARAAYSRQDYKNSIELFETLIKTYTNSNWRCDARFGQGDALTELGQFNDALLVFDAVIKDFADCYLRCEALGRKADCFYTLERYDDAITTYRAAQDCAKDSDGTFRNQIAYKTGQCFEKAGKADEAGEIYLKLLYETREWPDPSTPPECFWLGKAGLAAGTIKEAKQQWRDAITVYQRLLEVCPDMKDLLEERIRRIRVERFIWF